METRGRSEPSKSLLIILYAAQTYWFCGVKVAFAGNGCHIYNLSAIAERPCAYSRKGLRL
ncbi:MAG: hypothetical protein IJK42_12020 [Prevotella sp.]|nr:hypothetical protein [Prevotella sp.]